MPLTSYRLHKTDDWLTKNTDNWKGSLEWNVRHVALDDDGSPDSPWILEDLNGENCTDTGNLTAYHWTGLATDSYDSRVREIRAKSEYSSVEFDALSKRWHKDTRHVSLISEKIIHPAYLRIIGMGEAAIPLLLAALRERPAHWFTALRAITNTDPASFSDSPSMARDAWINWGILEGYID